jgi:hypothetical protein
LAPRTDRQGRPLSYWLYLYTASRYGWPHPEGRQPRERQKEAAEAIRSIGPAAVPYLVKWIAYEPNPLKTNFIIFMGRFRGGRFNHWIPESFTTDQAILRAVSARDGFAILGPVAHSAAPDLRRHLAHVGHPATAQHIVNALASIGPDGVLALSNFLTNSQGHITSEAISTARSAAVSALSRSGTNALPEAAPH